MKCKLCKKEMKGFWCDDGMHTPGTLYECSCGNKIWQEEGQEPVPLAECDGLY